MRMTLLTPWLWLVACGSPAETPPAHAVGTYLGGGSMLFGADTSGCIYEAPATVAEIGEPRTMAKLVGEGSVTMKCGTTTTIISVLRPTKARIDGPARIKVGSKSAESFRVQVLANDRDLDGVHRGGENPIWTLGDDCKDVAEYGPVFGSQDTGGPSVVRELVTKKPGPCTLKVSILGVSTERTITIE